MAKLKKSHDWRTMGRILFDLCRIWIFAQEAMDQIEKPGAQCDLADVYTVSPHGRHRPRTFALIYILHILVIYNKKKPIFERKKNILCKFQCACVYVWLEVQKV